MKRLFLLLVIVCSSSFGSSKNGFDLTGALIPEGEILSGGPPKDGIPAIHNPKFISSSKALKSFDSKDRAVVVEIESQKRAYPISILNWHEIVNDRVSGKPIVVSFCPLCGTAVVFNSTVKGVELKFGVSGLLYQSDVLLYDLKSDSLWSQIMTQAVTGKFKGEKLRVINAKHVMLHDYINRNPDVLVLSKDTGAFRNYDRNPYGDYESSDQIYFPVKFSDDSHKKKEWSLVILTKSDQLIIPISRLSSKKTMIEVGVGAHKVSVFYNKEKREIFCEQSKGVSCFSGYWFALKTFYPKAKVH